LAKTRRAHKLRFLVPASFWMFNFLNHSTRLGTSAESIQGLGASPRRWQNGSATVEVASSGPGPFGERRLQKR
jgi:hypothetical protein